MNEYEDQPTVEPVSQSHQEPIGVALNSAKEGEVVTVLLSGGSALQPQFPASENIPINGLVAFTRNRNRRFRDWLIRRLR